jgi:hypothetical protein
MKGIVHCLVDINVVVIGTYCKKVSIRRELNHSNHCIRHFEISIYFLKSFFLVPVVSDRHIAFRHSNGNLSSDCIYGNIPNIGEGLVRWQVYHLLITWNMLLFRRFGTHWR